MEKELLERFIRYAKIETRSDPNSETIPSTPTQTAFLEKLGEELKALGLEEVALDPFSKHLTATLPATCDKDVPVIGFIAHVDTADFNAHNVSPQIHENYDGEAIVLNEEEHIVLDPKEFPHLKNYVGQTLITTDGTTLLGSDDKSGVTEIVTAMHYLLDHPEIKHGKIRIAFTPDEEIGAGAENFNVEAFGAEFAYTMDGGPLGELQYESFNAAEAKIKIKGKNVHPGSAKDIMVNAMEVGIAFHSKLPQMDLPQLTDGRHGFSHLIHFNGTVEEAEMIYIIRDHDRTLFEAKKDYFQRLADHMNKEFKEERIFLTLRDEYYNMAEVIEKDKRSIEIAQEAMEDLGIIPVIEPIRGGTDGSVISFMGLPTPNVFAGGENFHGRYEFVSLEAMKKATDFILHIVELVAK